MTWIALTDRENSCFASQGLSSADSDATRQSADLDKEIPRGSIVLETRVSPYDRPQLLVGLERGFEHALHFAMQALPGGGVSIVHARGSDIMHGVLNHDSSASRTDILRVTYSWDMAHQWARLVVERPDAGRSFQALLSKPVGFTFSDIRELVCDRASAHFASDVLYLAVSDRIEPIGPMPGMAASTPVSTPNGMQPVGTLKRGDVVETLNGDLVPVLQVVKRTVPACGMFEPVRLRHPYFGLDRDIVVSAAQRLVVGGSRVEYLFGSEHVLVPARHLINGSAAIREQGHRLVTYTQLLLPDHEALHAAGTFVESLNIGRIRRNRGILHGSLLAQFARNTLPEHSAPVHPALSSFEALILAEQRAA